jgi:hypothetical protein
MAFRVYRYKTRALELLTKELNLLEAWWQNCIKLVVIFVATWVSLDVIVQIKNTKVVTWSPLSHKDEKFLNEKGWIELTFENY